MNPVLNQMPKTDPAAILHYRDGQSATELLAAAVAHLDLFTWIDQHEGADTEALVQQFTLAARPLDVLLTLCRANGFIVTDRRDHHTLTPLAREYLVANSPWFLGPYYTAIQHDPVVKDYLKVLHTGRPANWDASAEGDDWHQSILSEEFAREFTGLMNCRGLAFGQVLARELTLDLAERSHVLDVGGGSGIYAATLVARHPQLKATVLEQPPVDDIALEEIGRHGLNRQIDVVSANMFASEWPMGADTILLSNVLHDWDVPEVQRLLEKAADTLPRDGLLVIHEAFLNDDKTGPLPVAEYSALLMRVTQGKCYTPAEYGGLLKPLGFDVGPYRNTIADRGFITAVKTRD